MSASNLCNSKNETSDPAPVKKFTYNFHSVNNVTEKIAGSNNPLMARYLATAQQGHFYKGDPKFYGKEKEAIVQMANITDCSGIFITHDSYPVVHAYHAPPGCFPHEDDSSASTKGNIDTFLQEIATI